jgi:hypothetical protein
MTNGLVGAMLCTRDHFRDGIGLAIALPQW